MFLVSGLASVFIAAGGWLVCARVKRGEWLGGGVWRKVGRLVIVGGKEVATLYARRVVASDCVGKGSG